MVPIHETDLAQERWLKVEWENYELWEKVELRLKRKRRLWIGATLLTALMLSAIPIVADRWPKWRARSIARHLAQEFNGVKRDAIINRGAFRFRFTEEGSLSFVIERVSACGSAQGQSVRSGSLGRQNSASGISYVWLPSHLGLELGVPGLMSEFCYDFLQGSSDAKSADDWVGFAIIPAKDLAEKRMDRMSVLIYSGGSAEISFD